MRELKRILIANKIVRQKGQRKESREGWGREGQ